MIVVILKMHLLGAIYVSLHVDQEIEGTKSGWPSNDQIGNSPDDQNQ